jgi:hypothetical protein
MDPNPNLESSITRDLGDAVELLDGVIQNLEDQYSDTNAHIQGQPAKVYRHALQARDAAREAWWAMAAHDDTQQSRPPAP